MELTPNNSQDTKAHFDAFTRQLETLYDEITKKLYPTRRNWLIWLDTPPLSDSPWQKAVYWLTGSFLLNSVWFLLIFTSLAFISALAASLPASIGLAVLAVFGVISIGVSVLSYSRLWILLYYHKRPRLKWRILLTVSIFGISSLIVYSLIIGIRPIEGPWWLWLYSGLFITTPLLILVLLLLVNLIVRLLILYGYIRSYHSPSFVEIIPTLLFPEQQLSDSSAFSNWVFALTEEEFSLLKSLTELHLNSAEKRLIPTGIVFAFVGVFVDGIANTVQFQTLTDVLFSDLGQLSTAWPIVGATGFFLALLGDFASLLVTLLNRMTVSSIILEIWVWVKHYRDQDQDLKTLTKERISQPQKLTLGQWLAKKLPFRIS